jgi:hypothetical protein
MPTPFITLRLGDWDFHARSHEVLNEIDQRWFHTKMVVGHGKRAKSSTEVFEQEAD